MELNTHKIKQFIEMESDIPDEMMKLVKLEQMVNYRMQYRIDNEEYTEKEEELKISIKDNHTWELYLYRVVPYGTAEAEKLAKGEEEEEDKWALQENYRLENQRLYIEQEQQQ